MLVMANTCLSQQNTSFVAIKVCLLQQNFCRNKIMFVVTKYFCHGKTFVVIFYACHDKHLLQQAYFCHDKQCVLSRQTCVCHNKNKLGRNKIMFVVVATKV